MTMYAAYVDAMEAMYRMLDNLYPLTYEDMAVLVQKFDSRGIPDTLHYWYLQEENLFILKMSTQDWKRARYYLGWEYAEDAIVQMFKSTLDDDDVVVLFVAAGESIIDEFMEILLNR